MYGIKLLCVCALLCHYVTAASVVPVPLIQTSNVKDPGVEFVPLEASTTAKKQIEDKAFWHEIAMKQLRKNLKVAKKSQEKTHKAKNIIIFVGDGMGLSTITAGRIFKGQYLKHGSGEEELLAFDEFPYTGLSKTYNVDKQVPDSAGTATALFCGSKTDYGVIGLDTTRSKTNSNQGRLKSIMDWAQAEGKRTGVVTTTRITHATPSATYAHIYNRDWECDTLVPAESVGKYADVARQLVENAPGNKLNVIMGGGLSPMGVPRANEPNTVRFEGDNEIVCIRGDGRNLVQEWLKHHNNESSVFVQSLEELNEVNFQETDYLMGLFRNNHITYAVGRQDGEPSLKEMTQAAIKVLQRGDKSKGFVLMVEGGRIDQAHHQNYARAAMREVLEFDMAVQGALDLTDDDETLILVTADHSHAVTLNGYPTRGSDILGFANKTTDRIVYETISYANGPGYYDHLANGSVGAAGTVWLPLESFTAQQRMSPTYRHRATLPLKDETHGGEDVIVFANGPSANLIRGVFEQHYVAYVMSYAGCMGPAKYADDSCRVDFRETSSGSSQLKQHSFVFLGAMLLFNLFHS
ncbi:PREDICTED: alkaline phosphatase 4-like [Rhagoletis zephyria]|uniref:alkaline phosphatase 4-like n=1 Tax=Rhagoletis zephyria TaxID=28612 RepID=UPI0008117BBD|nr:PREDICTED: alkaline phosphatase 4-like [Rhagoletis zephyria]XP_036325402.1 alkaline phosphatase 4 [Rhagoletis pomonella]